MPRLNAYIHNAIAQLFDEIEDKCKVKFATFTASDTQGQQNLAAGTREYMEDRKNNESNGVYKYLYDPGLSFDFRFHQRLAAAPFVKTSKPWATIMFNVKQVRPLTNVLSHRYHYIHWHDGLPYQMKTRRVSAPVNMVIVSNDMDKLYETTEKVAMYFDRFINYHYDEVVTVGKLDDGGFDIYQSKVGHAANIREVDLTKLDTEQRGSLVSSAFQFDLVYWIEEAPDTSLHILKRIILELKIDDWYKEKFIVFDTTEGNDFDVKETATSKKAEADMRVTMNGEPTEFFVQYEHDVADDWVE